MTNHQRSAQNLPPRGSEMPSVTPVEKPEHDPSTILVEHNDADPNSPTYTGDYASS